MNIYISFILFFTIIIIEIQANISESKIKEDAAKWAELHKKYINAAPEFVFRENFRRECYIVEMCCPEKFNNVFNILHEHKVDQMCIGDRSSKRYENFPSYCAVQIIRRDEIRNSTDFAKLVKAHTNIPNSNERFRSWRIKMAQVCSADELKAYHCEPDNMEKFQSCQEKVLRSVAKENGGKNYNAYMRQLQDHYRIYMQRLAQQFPNLA